MERYDGPLRDEPTSIELHNTLYAAGGVAHDGLRTGRSTRAWMRGLAERLPAGGSGEVRREELVDLRGTVRVALQAVAEDEDPPDETVEVLNAASARAPSHLAAYRSGDGGLVAELDAGSASRADVVLAALAGDAITLITGPERDAIHACGAPGCVLLYLKSHPRQSWCSAACGNRARQARHYARSRSPRS